MGLGETTRSAARRIAVLAAVAISCATARPREPTAAVESVDPEAATSRHEGDAGAAAEAPDIGRTRARSSSPPEQGASPAQTANGPLGTATSVREAVSAVAAARGRTPRALHAIADMLERVTDGGHPAAAWIERMRGEAATLERMGAVDLDRADRVKAALDHGIEAMREVARAEEWLEGWVDAAAAAVNAIDPATPLGLQRAAVQDALRSLADAVLVVAQFARR